MALTGWAALILQLYIIISNAVTHDISITGAIIKYLSYFTILTNILVALSLTIPIVKPASYIAKFFSSGSIKTAIAVYIIIVGIIYNLLLRQLWNPQGLQLVADILLHQLIPAAYVVYWLAFVQKSSLEWKQSLIWLMYPLVYLVYAIIRGAITGHYPYPFIDASQLGFNKMLLNIFVVSLGFISVGLLLVAIDKKWKK